MADLYVNGYDLLESVCQELVTCTNGFKGQDLSTDSGSGKFNFTKAAET